MGGKKRPRVRRSERALDRDDALVALLIAAMDASGHVSADEAARAQNILWSTRRFRSRSGEGVGRRIDRMRRLVSERGTAEVIEHAARLFQKRLRPAAFALAADIVLVDGRMERPEARFLRELARDLELESSVARNIQDVIRLKNSI